MRANVASCLRLLTDEISTSCRVGVVFYCKKGDRFFVCVRMIRTACELRNLSENWRIFLFPR